MKTKCKCKSISEEILRSVVIITHKLYKNDILTDEYFKKEFDKLKTKFLNDGYEIITHKIE